MNWLKKVLRPLRNTFLRRPYFFRFLLPDQPASRVFGSDRGQPIDRYYINRFILSHANDICGDVLEIGDPDYTKKYGRNFKSLTVLHYEKSTYSPTIIGNLERHETLPEEKFDCFICPQTFQYIYNFEKGIQGAYKMLREGGVLLATLPAISQTSVGKGDSWKEFWRFREETVLRGFGNVFGEKQIKVESFGNVKVGASFYYGLALEDIPADCLDVYDPNYPFLFTVRAIKRKIS